MIALTDASAFSLAIGLHWTLFGIRGLAGPAIGTWLYSSGLLSLNDIFWLITGLLVLGSCLMMFYALRSSPRGPRGL
jgi:hypothetical protein